MTKTYNDVTAVTRLLEEKEKDLELAARIGQGLLHRNKALEDRLTAVEGELTSAHDTVTQLKHDLALKAELLQIYTNDFDDSSPEGVRAFTYDVLQKKVKGLENDNRQLRAEASMLASDTSAVELREEKLMRNLMAQLNDANSHIKNLDDELANKYEESSRQKEELTSLLTQLISQRHKIRELTLENEELVMQLRVVRDCQDELASELSDYKDKYGEILDILRDTQEQLRQQHKKSFPTVRGISSNGSVASNSSPRMSSFHPESLASELELSSLCGSDGWMSSTGHPSLEFHSTPHHYPKYQFQKVFDTIKCASQIGATAVTMTSSSSVNTRSQEPYCVQSSAAGQNHIKSTVNQTKPETEYPGTSRVGIPGTPGTVDLINALRRLTPKDHISAAGSYGWRTPDSIMSTGSRNTQPTNYAACPEKLKIIKPIEGSTTLHHWARLATPHLGSLLEDRPGVATRETRHEQTVQYSRQLLDEMYSLFDVEEDEDFEFYPGRSFEPAATITTITNSTVLHPDDETRVTCSLQGLCMSTIPEQHRPDSGGSSHSPTPAAAHSGSRRNSVTTFSTQMSLAKALHERGTDHPSMTPAELSAPAALLGGCWSGLSTPNNSPESSGRSSPAGAVFLGPLDLLQQGARMIQRTLTGAAGGCWSEKEQPSPTLPPRIPREELETLSKLNLVEKLEKLSLDSGGSAVASCISADALQVALRKLCPSTTRTTTTPAAPVSPAIVPGHRKPACPTPLFGRPCVPGRRINPDPAATLNPISKIVPAADPIDKVDPAGDPDATIALNMDCNSNAETCDCDPRPARNDRDIIGASTSPGIGAGDPPKNATIDPASSSPSVFTATPRIVGDRRVDPGATKKSNAASIFSALNDGLNLISEMDCTFDRMKIVRSPVD